MITWASAAVNCALLSLLQSAKWTLEEMAAAARKRRATDERIAVIRKSASHNYYVSTVFLKALRGPEKISETCKLAHEVIISSLN